VCVHTEQGNADIGQVGGTLLLRLACRGGSAVAADALNTLRKVRASLLQPECVKTCCAVLRFHQYSSCTAICTSSTASVAACHKSL
jgi:hypothetical protein